MKILLINPPIEQTFGSIMPKKLEEGLDFLPPLGLLYVAAAIEKEAIHRVQVIDAQIERLDVEALQAEIKKREPDAIGITAMTFTLLDVIATIKAAKKINPKIKIILSGPHAIIFPEETMMIKEVDFLVLGEGEKVIGRLLSNINKPEELKKIKGLAFRDRKKIISTGQADFIENLDELPFPARRLTPYKNYSSVVSARRPVTTMFSSRGCPYRCLFCDRPQVGKTFRARSAKSVADEMEECQKLGIKEIFIYDDTFAVDRQRVLDICAQIKTRGITIAWDIRTRVNTVDEEILRALKDAGCQRIHYGVEAGTQKILNVLQKGITLEQIKQAFTLTKKVGIQTAGYFMIGSPTETKQDILQTINFMKQLNPDYAQVAITTPFPATDLYKLAQAEGVIRGDPWREFAKKPTSDFIPPIWEKELSRQELLELLKKAYRSFYFRPSFIIKKIAALKSSEELWQKGRAALRLLKI
jgi:anaerobic magnesium-protoporphyrin IX monomethyl ester cyclase